MKYHYSGALGYRHSDGKTITIIHAGLAACGARSTKILDAGYLTTERRRVTCRHCLALLVRADESCPPVRP